MNRCHLLSVLVDEPAEDHRASPDMLNRTVAAMTEPPAKPEELVGLAGKTFSTVIGSRRPESRGPGRVSGVPR
jgi:hypothetical protein